MVFTVTQSLIEDFNAFSATKLSCAWNAQSEERKRINESINDLIVQLVNHYRFVWSEVKTLVAPMIVSAFLLALTYQKYSSFIIENQTLVLLLVDIMVKVFIYRYII